MTQEKALEHVVGYVLVNDISEREFQTERGPQWDKGKGCDTFGPVGPYLVTRDEVPNLKAFSSGWMSMASECRMVLLRQ